MPNYVNVPQPPDGDLERAPFTFTSDTIDQAIALSLVTKTFSHYESFRLTNHDNRYNNSDALYYAWRPQENWDGTTVAKSSLGSPLTFSQVEAALPAVMQAIFGIDEWFSVEAVGTGATPQQARDVRDALLGYFDNADNGVSFQSELQLAIKNILLYGTGGVAVEWNPVKGRPEVTNVDIREIYFDPSSSVPWVEGSKAIIRQKFMSARELAALRNTSDMSIPSDDILYSLSAAGSSTSADNTKAVAEAYRGVSFNPSQHRWSINPADRPVEVLIYHSADRIIWVLGRKWVAFNKKNPYGLLPYAFTVCYTVPGRFYGMGIGDVQEGTQRTQEGLLNSHLNEVNLAVNPPRAIRRGGLQTPAQQRWSPGATYPVNDTKDIAILQAQPMTTNVFSSLEYLEAQAEKRTGISALNSGVPRASNANRTLGGMQMQMQGSALRLYPIVKNIEDFLVSSMLYKMHKMVMYHVPWYAQLAGRTPEGEIRQVSAGAFSYPVNYKVQAASRMLSRERLQQVVPVLLQYLAQGPLLAEMQKVGKTIDWEEMAQMIMDATGVGRTYQLIREFTPEEQQAQQAPPPELQAQQQQAQQDAQTRKELMQMKNQTELQKEQMKLQDPNAQMKAQVEAEVAKVKLQLEQQLAQMKIEFEKQKMALEQQKAEMKLAMEQRRAQTQAETAQNQAGMQMMHEGHKHQMSMQQMIEKAAAQKRAGEIAGPVGVRGAQQTAKPGPGGAGATKTPKKKAVKK